MTVGSAGVAAAGTPQIGRAKLVQMVVRSEEEGRNAPVFFDTIEAAASAYNRLLGTVTTAAKAGCVAKVISLGYRFFEAVKALGPDVQEKLNQMLTAAACIACKQTVQLKWRKVKAGYELDITACSC